MQVVPAVEEQEGGIDESLVVVRMEEMGNTETTAMQNNQQQPNRIRCNNSTGQNVPFVGRNQPSTSASTNNSNNSMTPTPADNNDHIDPSNNNNNNVTKAAVFAGPNQELNEDMIRPHRLDIVLHEMEKPTRSEQEAHGWNASDRSLNIFVRTDDKLTFHRHPVAQSTDAIRGLNGFSRGFHVWETTWPKRQRGTHAIVGVATAEQSLHSAGYHGLVGSTAESWGLDLGRHRIRHDGAEMPKRFPPATDVHTDNGIPDSFLTILDMDEGTLAYAHSDAEPMALMSLCRRAIRRQIGRQHPQSLVLSKHIDRLQGIPPSLKKYLLYQQL